MLRQCGKLDTGATAVATMLSPTQAKVECRGAAHRVRNAPPAIGKSTLDSLTPINVRLAARGSTVLSGSPEAFGKLIADETEQWAKVIKFAGTKAD
jgi:hypothetical protein